MDKPLLLTIQRKQVPMRTIKQPTYKKCDISVLVITYNQENYIEDCLKGVLSQKTKYTVEYIICDDHSMDRTWDNIMKAIENHSQKNIKLIRHQKNIGAVSNSMYALELASGKYIAACEGDDIWLDENKIEKQLSEMERYPEVNISFHPARKGSKQTNSMFRYMGDKIAVIDAKTISKNGGSFMPSPSVIFRGSSIRSILPYLDGADASDVYYQIWCSLQHGALYLPWPMALYRTGVGNSWSAGQKSFRDRLKHLRKQLLFSRKFVKRLPGDKQSQMNQALTVWLGEKFMRLFKQSANSGQYGVSVIAIWYLLLLRPRVFLADLSIKLAKTFHDR